MVPNWLRHDKQNKQQSVDKHTKPVVERACGVVYTVVYTLDTILQCMYIGPAVHC